MAYHIILNKSHKITILLLLLVNQFTYFTTHGHTGNDHVKEFAGFSNELFTTDTISLCNEPVQLNGTSGYDHYIWNTGEISEKITVNSPGRYIAKASLNSGETVLDTFIVINSITLTTRPLVGCGDDLILLNNGVIENVNGKVIELFSDRARANQLNASVKISTRHSTQGKFNAAIDYKKYIDDLVSHPPTNGFGDAYLPEYKFVSNSIVFNGPKNNIAYKYTIRFFSKTAGIYRFRTSFDFGNGGAIFLDGNIAAFNNADMWWNNNWNLPGQSLQWSTSLNAGMHEILVYGLEDCCDGGGSAEYKGPGDPEFTAFSTLAYVNYAGTYFVSLHDPVSGCSVNDSIIVTRSPKPLIAVNNPPAVCKPALINLTLPSVTEGSEPTLNFSYFKNPALTIPVTDPATITDSGSYYIVGQAENSCKSVAKEILVNIFSTPVASFSASKKNGCANQPVTFKNTTPINASFRLHWDFGTTNLSDTSNEVNPIFTYNTVGHYPVKLTVFSPGGCSASYTDSIWIYENPVMSISGPSKVCIDEEVQFTGNNTGPAISSQTWIFGNGIQSDLLKPPLFHYSIAGDYFIQLIGRSSVCSDTAIVPIKVFPGPAIGLANPETSICLGNSIQLNAHDGITYEWTPATGLDNPLIANPIAYPITDTRYRIKVTSVNGCVGLDSVLLRVNQPISISVNNDERVCAGDEVHLHADGALKYEWTPAETLINPNSANPIAKPMGTMLYQVTGYGKDNCFSDTAFVRVDVDPLPSVIAGNDTTIMAGTPVQLHIRASADVIRYNWAPGTGLNCTNCPEPFSNPLNATLYTVTVQNEAGCLASDNIGISLNCSVDNVYIPNAFTPNNDGRNDIFYPMGKGIRIVNYLRIYNRWGKIVFERRDFMINNRNAGWDGKINGLLQPTQSYVYATQLICEDGQLIELKGNLTLVQ